ncbi:MAG TPA: DNA primase, partial [Nitrospirota bacterium]|nr:DNA primase [Nitrospirota bacterium]
GVGGDAFKFLELQERMSFPETVKSLASRAGIQLPADGVTWIQDNRNDNVRKALLTICADATTYFGKELAGPAGSEARSYLNKRGVNDTAITEFALGYARPEWDGLLLHLKQKGYTFTMMEKAGLIVKRNEGEGFYDRFRGRIIFPIRDMSGNVIAFGGRVMDASLPKYLNSPETPLYNKSNVLYLLDKAKENGRKQGYFIIVEGYLDAIASHQFGIKNVIATLGTALTEGHLRQIRRFAQKIILIFDPDPAGVKATMRGLDLFVASGMKVNVVSLPHGEDPDTFLHKHGSDAFTACLRESIKFMDFVLKQVMGGRPPHSIDEKVEKADEMLLFIAKLPNGIERDYYLKKTAEALDLDETVLRQEMPKKTKRSSGISPEKKIITAARGSRPRAEEILIHLMLKDEDIAISLYDQIKPQDFSDPLLQRAAEKIFSVLDAKGKIDVNALLTEGDVELNQLISHFSVLDLNYEDPQKHCRDCVDRIKQQDPEKKIRLLVKAIQEAETRGDSATVARLLGEQNALSRRPGRKIPGR